MAEIWTFVIYSGGGGQSTSYPRQHPHASIYIAGSLACSMQAFAGIRVRVTS
jgi:hypothetical protein